MSYVLTFAWYFFFLFLIGRWKFFRNTQLGPLTLCSIFSLKILAGFLLILIYTYYYTDRHTADIYKYFDDATVIYSALKENPLHYFQLITGIGADNPELDPYRVQMRNWADLSQEWLSYTKTRDLNLFNSHRLVTRFNALIMPLTLGNIYTHVVFICFLSFAGLCALYRQVQPLVPGRKELLAAAIFLTPSTLLWCSGILKDTILLAAVNISIYLIFQLPNKYRIGIPAIIGCFLIILYTKYYVLAALIPAVAGYTLYRFSGKRISIINANLVVILLLLGGVTVHASLSENNIFKLLADKREESLKSAIWGDAAHQVFYHRTGTEPGDILPEIVPSIFAAIARPLPHEVKSPMLWVASLENIVLIILILWATGKVLRGKARNLHPLFYFSILYSGLLAFIIGFTTPVTGGLVRYKTAFLPYLLVAFVMLADENNRLNDYLARVLQKFRPYIPRTRRAGN